MTTSFKPDMTQKVIVAMSGGVDSSVAALLLKQQGYPVEGLFMKNWEEDDTETYCSAAQDVADAQAVCDALQIKLHTVNFAAEYWDNVFSHFLAEYQAGRTPNPDILCNREIKFKACLDYAQYLGATYFATGHYARTENGALLRGMDNNKDQSYFLYTLTPDILRKTFFPIGELPKSTVRQLAAQAGFCNHAKKDSTGICFIGERRFRDFLARYLPAQPGEIQTVDGKTIGQHAGVLYYTLGQRQGLGIGGQKNSNGKPWYVIEKRLAENVLIVAQRHDHPRLFSRALVCEQVHWITPVPPALPLRCQIKIRYRQSDQAGDVINCQGNRYTVVFDQPQWAVTPGQSVVFYQDDHCLGGGIITVNNVTEY